MLNKESTQTWPFMAVLFPFAYQAPAIVLGKLEGIAMLIPLNICSWTSCQSVQSLSDLAAAICLHDHP